MKNKLSNGQHLSLDDQVALLSEFVMTIEHIPKVLHEIRTLPGAWVGAGVIFQNVGNVMHGYAIKR